MENLNELFNIQKPHLVGKLVLSPVSKGHIVDIKTPEDGSVITITSKDLQDKNIHVMKDFVPIFADGYVKYLGQPLMAVFGPDIETVDMFCSNLAITIDTVAAVKLKTPDAQLDPFIWTSGNIAKHFTEDAKKIESEFTFESQSINLPADERILACFDDGICHIKISSQWPLHVKESVASTLGMDKSRIRVHIKSFRADFDQLLVQPSMFAGITALASKKGNCLAELLTPAISWQPETKYKRTTVINSEGKPLAEKISVVTDFGAFPLFAEEAYLNILAGLIPPYDLNAVEVTIQILKSTKNPAFFFGDLGYGMAVAFTEQHFTKIAKTVGKSPYEWRAENLQKVSLISEKVRKCITYDSLRQALDECASDSWFNRKYSVYSQEHFIHHSISPIAGYAKGVGIACGHGVGGFSERYPFVEQNNVSITMTEDRKVYVSVGFYIANDTITIYKELIHERLNVEIDNIFFNDFNTNGIKDFGPNVLSRSICVIPKLLESACSLLEKRIAQGSRLPLIQQVFYPLATDSSYFEANSFGSVVISLHIDSVKLVPVIDNITARLKFGKVFKTTILARRIRQTICNTISRLCPCTDNNYSIDLKVRSNPHLPAGSCSSMLCGITMAAFASALSQALGHEVYKFPLNDQDIFAIVQMNATQGQNDEN